jgi:glycosyltransferase involved in cell wall biosynthesis
MKLTKQKPSKSAELRFPKISVVIATFNAERVLEKCLISLREQNYPQDRIELIIADGGSTDSTKKIVTKYQGRIVSVPKDLQGAEFNKGFGLQYVTGEFILCIDYDNVLPHKEWLNKMLAPLLKDDQTVAVEPLRYRHDKSYSLLDRYFALFGVNDPVAYYLGKADKIDYFHNNYNLLGNPIDKGEYYLVKFDKKDPTNIPTLGANGFLIRKSIFEKSNHAPEDYLHIDINVDLVKQGYDRYAFIKDDIIHLTNNKFFNFIKRRKMFMDKYYLQSTSERRYKLFDGEKYKIKLLLFVLYSMTIVKPLIDSFRGWVKVPDSAWFVHPFMCLAVVYIYGTSIIKNQFTKNNK